MHYFFLFLSDKTEMGYYFQKCMGTHIFYTQKFASIKYVPFTGYDSLLLSVAFYVPVPSGSKIRLK